MSNTRDKTRRDWIGYAIAAAATCLVLIAVAGWWLIGQRVWTDDQTIRVRDGDASVRQVLWTQPRPVDEGPAPVDKINTEADEYEPSLSPDGTELYFVRGLPGGQEHADIFVSERREGKWTAPQPVKGVNTAANELGPRLSADGALLYFYSDRAGGQGQYDLWASRRGESGWEEPFNLGPSVNSAANEFNPAPSPDGTRLFFATNRKAAGLAGHHQRWNATIRHNPSATDYDLFVAEVREGGDRGQGTGV